MINEIKAIYTKEILMEIKNKSYLTSILMNIVLILIIGILSYSFSSTYVQSILFIEMSLLIIPTFFMWTISLPFIQSKFGDEKITHKIEAISATPIPIKSVWVGKMISIFILTYPMVLIISLIISIFWIFAIGLNYFNILPVSVWLVTLIINPMLIMLYVGFSSWAVLRFNQPRIMEALNFAIILISIAIFLFADDIFGKFTPGGIINLMVTLYYGLGLLVCYLLLFVLISKLNKEKVNT